MKSSSIIVLLIVLVIASTAPVFADDSTQAQFAKSREHFQKGRYEEAVETLDKLAQEKPADLDSVRVALLRSEALRAQGERSTAEEIVV